MGECVVSVRYQEWECVGVGLSTPPTSLTPQRQSPTPTSPLPRPQQSRTLISYCLYISTGSSWLKVVFFFLLVTVSYA